MCGTILGIWRLIYEPSSGLTRNVINLHYKYEQAIVVRNCCCLRESGYGQVHDVKKNTELVRDEAGLKP